MVRDYNKCAIQLQCKSCFQLMFLIMSLGRVCAQGVQLRALLTRQSTWLVQDVRSLSFFIFRIQSNDCLISLVAGHFQALTWRLPTRWSAPISLFFLVPREHLKRLLSNLIHAQHRYNFTGFRRHLMLSIANTISFEIPTMFLIICFIE